MRLRWTGTTDTTIPGGYIVSPDGVIEVTHGTRQMLKDRELWVDADAPVDERPTQEQLDELQALVNKLQAIQEGGGFEPGATAQGGDDEKAQEPSQEGQSDEAAPTEPQTATAPDPAPEKTPEPSRSHHKKD